MKDVSYQQALVTVAVLVSFTFGGCLTLNPSVMANTDNSTVFKNLSVSESWASQRVRVNVTLTSSSDAGNVTQLTVVKQNGRTFSTVKINPGQTSVILELPTNQNMTLVASDTINGTTIEKLNVSTRGKEIP